jgi:hypothetical protein
MMSRCYIYGYAIVVTWWGQLGESGSLEREGQGERCGYSEVPRW